MMLSSVLVVWTAVVVAYLCPQEVYAVVVTTTLNVVTDPNTGQVILPCEYKLENPNQKCNFRWDLGREVVIVNDSLDQIFYGDRYRDRVYWGNGCSLILLNPCLNDTGRFTFRAFAPYDSKDTDSGHTSLIVVEISTRETTTGEVETGSQPTEPNTVSPEDGYTSPAWVYGLSIPVIIIGLIAITSDVVVLRFLERHGRTHIRHRLLLGSSILLVIVGIITAVVGIRLRHAVDLLGIVSAYPVFLGVAIHMIYICWKLKPKAFFLGKADREDQVGDGTKTNLEYGEKLLFQVSSFVSQDSGLA